MAGVWALTAPVVADDLRGSFSDRGLLMLSTSSTGAIRSIGRPGPNVRSSDARLRSLGSTARLSAAD